MKALVGAFNQEKALVGAFSVIVQPVVEPMEYYTALILGVDLVSSLLLPAATTVTRALYNVGVMYRVQGSAV